MPYPKHMARRRNACFPCVRSRLARRVVRSRVAALAVLLLSHRVSAFPLTMGLGNTGAREFHFCQLDVMARPVACAGAPNCLEFETGDGPLWLDVQRTASLSESATGTTLLDDMFQYAQRMSLVGDPALLAQVRPQPGSGRLELHGFWYPSGRRLLLLSVQPTRSVP